jgi:hypothetical protein
MKFYKRNVNIAPLIVISYALHWLNNICGYFMYLYVYTKNGGWLALRILAFCVGRAAVISHRHIMFCHTSGGISQEGQYELPLVRDCRVGKLHPSSSK